MTPQPPGALTGSHDGSSARDHDVPFHFGWRTHAAAPYPFSTRQYVRVLVLRSQVQQPDVLATEVEPPGYLRSDCVEALQPLLILGTVALAYLATLLRHRF